MLGSTDWGVGALGVGTLTTIEARVSQGRDFGESRQQGRANANRDPLTLFDIMYLLMSLAKSTPPQNRQLNISICNRGNGLPRAFDLWNGRALRWGVTHLSDILYLLVDFRESNQCFD